MEKLKIDNFLVLSKVDIPIKKINIVIGPQSVGKSIIAKILYFIYTIPNEIRDGIFSGSNEKEIFEALAESFKKIFPPQYWSLSNFQITYKLNDLTIKISNKEDKRNSLNIEFDKVHALELKQLTNLNRRFDQVIQERLVQSNLNFKSNESLKYKLDATEVKFDIFREAIENSKFNLFFDKSGAQFVPAARAVFSIFSDNSALENQTDDPIIKKFAQTYKTHSSLHQYVQCDNPHTASERLRNKVQRIFEKILKGKFVLKEKKAFLSINNQIISVKNISSGQQEILPLMIMLTFEMFLTHTKLTPYFIEEPEAHLFPEAQCEVMNLISLLSHNFDSQFFITTHSPYLLTILNNFIYADELIKSGKLSLEKFNEISNDGFPLDFNDIHAFSIQNGESISIMDTEFKLVDTNFLDSASKSAENIFDELLYLDS
ncbi:AAA family ATPase [Acinetobacter baumannii]|uniref:AAA family ATPase n=1 Tax=Acinetobacter baumannii TaxID=470 RepID=UPI0024488FD1|nr:AAA family ATPase [Acinetobacter baumannii]MDH2510826.1 AAA family ATPase [Acinetobacter baumannii]